MAIVAIWKSELAWLCAIKNFQFLPTLATFIIPRDVHVYARNQTHIILVFLYINH